MKTTCFTPKPPCFGLVFAAALTLAGLVSSCVKPIGFPIDIKAQLTGEIGIDNINSAEIQFINHTKSMDIEKIEITRLLLGEDETAPYGLDSRLLGGPHAGTKESVLLRPIGTNAMATITTLAYEIEISYRKATAPVPVEASNKSVFERLKTESGEGSIKFGKGQAGDMAVLPRGKTIVHFYRAANGDIELQVSDPTGDANSVDYVQNVTVVDSGGGVNLNNLEVKLTSLPAVTVDFSDGVKKMIRDLHIKVTDVEKAVNNVAANTLTVAKVIADAILSGSSPYGNNYSLLLIQNWTARTAAVKLSQKYSFNGSTFQTDLNFGSLGQMSSGLGQQYAVLKNGAWDAGVDINGVTISYPNIVLPAQKYLHIYEKTFGHNIYASEQEFGALLAGNVLIDINQKYRSNEYKYGRIEVQNYSSAELAGIGFLKRDDPSTKFVIQDITKGKGKTRDQVSGAPNAEMFNPGKSMSDGVLAGDYFITVLTKGGSIVMQDHATTIKAEAFTSGNDNKIYIFEDDITVIPPVIINWTVSANGGPPAAQNQAAYTTTLLTFTFDSAPGNSIKFTKSGGTAAVGPLTKVDAKTFTMAVTTSVETQESLFFTTATANVAPGPKGVVVYKHTAQQPQQPVTTTRHFYKASGVTNTMPLLRHQGHQLEWFLSYETATYTNGVETGSRTTTTLKNFGSFVIDGSNDTVGSDSDNDYVRFNQSGSWGNPNNSTRAARLRVGTWVSGTWMAKDKPPRTSGEWEFYTGLDFNADLSALGIVIENMPKADVPIIYGLPWTLHKYNYLPVTFTIQNRAP